MALPFRRQIFAWLVVIALIPASIAVAVFLFPSQIVESAGGVEAWERAAHNWRLVRPYLEPDSLPGVAAAAVRQQDDDLSVSLRRAMQARRLQRSLVGPMAGLAIALAILVGGGAVRLAGHLSRQLSRPIDELVEWTGMIRRGEPLPEAPPVKGAPEFATLRASFRRMAGEIALAREREVEAARLRTFRDMARQVAHELKNPLTSILFALDRLEQDATPQAKELLALLQAESRRLEGMARDFGELGRMPEGPKAPVDLAELLQTLAATMPEGVTARVEHDAGVPLVTGHYEPLRRAFQNIVINACHAVQAAQQNQETRGQEAKRPSWEGQSASSQQDDIVMAVRGVANGAGRHVEVTIRDNGIGMDPGTLARLFEPYYTTKEQGTGLGLTLVRQTVLDHGGTISVASEPGRGATFTITLPVDRA